MSICQNLNSTQEMSFIAGNTQYLDFECVDENGQTINLATGSAKVDFSPYGDSNYVVLSKNGVIYDGNKFTITLNSGDTINLGGLYSFQPIITDVQGKDYRPLQGKIYIQPAIK